MSSRRPTRQLLVAVLLGLLVGGGLMAVTPAGAEVSQAAATSWKKIWKKELKPLAAKAFYTRKKADSTFATKAESAAGDAAANASTDTKLGSYYKKTEADAKYAASGSSYTKAESDARYAPVPSVIRGTYDVLGYSNAAGAELADNIAFGWTLPSAPVTHYINDGAAVPAGCSGTVAAPNADPGHLCVFEAQSNLANQRRTINAGGSYGLASPFGAGITVTTTGAGNVYVYGSWAVRPASPVAAQGLGAPKGAPSGAPSGAVAGN